MLTLFACNITMKLDVNDYSLARITLVLLLHYLGKFEVSD